MCKIYSASGNEETKNKEQGMMLQRYHITTLDQEMTEVMN